MALILSLETSTNVCSVALHEKGKLLIDREIHIPQSHASRLAPLIEEVVRVSGRQIKQLTAVALASGPGSYTGLRIGTSTAKGLCYSLNIPLVAIGTLDLLAYQMSQSNSAKIFLCPMLDARRMEVYCKVVDAELKTIQEVEAKVIDSESFQDILSKGKMLFFGDGAAKCSGLINHENAVFVENIYPAASHLGVLADSKLEAGIVEDVVHFEPFYLKDFLIRKPA